MISVACLKQSFSSSHPLLSFTASNIMSLLFARSIRGHSSKVQAIWYACRHECRRSIAASASSMDFLAPRGITYHKPYPDLHGKSSFENIVAIATTADTSLISIGANAVNGLRSLLGGLLGDLSTWLIKRTYQPSIIRKRRKHGFMRRKESVGGRRVLKRRLAKGRMRLGGSWCRCNRFTSASHLTDVSKPWWWNPVQFYDRIQNNNSCPTDLRKHARGSQDHLGKVWLFVK